MATISKLATEAAASPVPPCAVGKPAVTKCLWARRFTRSSVQSRASSSVSAGSRTMSSAVISSRQRCLMSWNSPSRTRCSAEPVGVMVMVVNSFGCRRTRG